MTRHAETAFTFHFRGGGADDRQIPIDVLLGTLKDFKDAINAANEDVDGECAVMAGVPQAGSFVMPVSVTEDRPDLFDSLPFAGQTVARLLRDPDDDADIPAAKRKNILRKFRNMLKSAAAMALSIGVGDGYEVAASELAPKVKNACAAIEGGKSATDAMVVTGYLERADFSMRKFTIVYPPTNIKFQCDYPEDIETELLEHRRSLVQVFGAAQLNEHGEAVKITKVERIGFVDLSPLKLTDIDLPGRVLRFKKPREIVPAMSDDRQLYTAADPELGIDVYGETRAELEDNLRDYVAFRWDEFAKAGDCALSGDALELKRNLLDNIEETKEDGNQPS